MKDTATYWAPTGEDKYGKTSFSTPVTLTCRWEDRVEQILNKKGSEIVSKSRIYISEPADVSIDGYLFFGTSAELNPIGLVGAWEIQQLGRSPDLRGLKNLTVAHL